MAKTIKIEVSRRALDQRLARIIQKKGLVVRRAAGADVLINIEQGKIVEMGFDVEAYAREQGALKPWEKLV